MIRTALFFLWAKVKSIKVQIFCLLLANSFEEKYLKMHGTYKRQEEKEIWYKRMCIKGTTK